jgi:hypothetical protein
VSHFGNAARSLCDLFAKSDGRRCKPNARLKPTKVTALPLRQV